MQDASDQELLREYAERRSEAAFTALVRRHVDLVYASALRTVREPHLAQDVSQSVFSALAANANALSKHPVLAGWLHRTTQNLAANLVRHEVRRRAREAQAILMNDDAAGRDSWASLEPHLEEALASLRDRDRELVLLRFFQGKSPREIADLEGLTGGTAQKRLNRAVERLRRFFVRRGIAVTGSALGAALSAHAIQAAPSGLARAIAQTALQGLAPPGAALAAAHGIAMTATQKAVVAVSLALAAGTGLYEARQTGVRTRDAAREADALAAAASRIEALERGRRAGVAAAAELEATAERLRRDAAEVHLLRGEVTRLRAEAVQARPAAAGAIPPAGAALAGWLKRTDSFKQAQYRLPEKSIPELALLTEEDWLDMARKADGLLGEDFPPDDPDLNRKMLRTAREKAKLKLGFLLSTALNRYCEAHEDHLPSEVSLLRPYFVDREAHLGGSAEFVSDAMLSRYRMLQSGVFKDVSAEKAVILAEAAPADPDLDTRLLIGKHWLQTVDAGDPGYWTGLPAARRLPERP